MHIEPVQIYIDVCRSLGRDAGMLAEGQAQASYT